MRRLDKKIKSFLQRFDIALTRFSKIQKAKESLLSDDVIHFVLELPREQIAPFLKNLLKSHSQIRQDLFALTETNFKREGFFVEFGATNGVDLSNSYLLEKEFGWNGILAEPAHCWHTDLYKNRHCMIETNCVWTDSTSTLEFNEVNELSTVHSFSDKDMHQKAREKSKIYKVQTISLLDLLKKHQAPRDIDYLSIDTEGSEFDILNSFDFNQYSFRVITCEHNDTPNRQKIYDLLTSHGYRRKFEHLSQFDDWYVKS